MISIIEIELGVDGLCLLTYCYWWFAAAVPVMVLASFDAAPKASPEESGRHLPPSRQSSLPRVR